MNIDDLVWQSRTLGGIPPRLVTMLLEQREVELLVQAASERGEWFCAEAAVRELSRAGEAERALEVLEPFIEAGWRPARWKRAEVLLEAGRVRQALDEVRPDEEGLASERVCHDFAELLAKAGRLDEAITVLTPHLDSSWILSALVELTEGQGRDEQVLELIAPRAQRVRSARGGKRWCVERSNAQDLQARVLERAGRVDEAIRILGADIAAGHFVVQNTLIAYAELLLRHAAALHRHRRASGPLPPAFDRTAGPPGPDRGSRRGGPPDVRVPRRLPFRRRHPPAARSRAAGRRRGPP